MYYLSHNSRLAEIGTSWTGSAFELSSLLVTSLLLLSTSTARVLVRHRTETVGQSISDDLLPYILYGGI